MSSIPVMLTTKEHDESPRQEQSDIQLEETEGVAGVEEGGKKRKRKRKRSRKSKSSEDAEDVGDSTARTVYVEGISYDASEEELEQFFSECGTVKDVRMPRWQDSGKPRGYAHVDFETASGVASALKLDGSDMLGRYLKISVANEKKSLTNNMVGPKPAGCKTIFIKNLPYEATESQVEEAFKVCGKINHVRLPRWQHTGRLKGIGYVQFRNEDSTEIAVKKRGTITVGGRQIVIDYETGSMKKSFKTRDGRSWGKVHGKQHKKFKRGPKW
jgi:nucleolin|eukprot:g3884.t1